MKAWALFGQQFTQGYTGGAGRERSAVLSQMRNVTTVKLSTKPKLFTKLASFVSCRTAPLNRSFCDDENALSPYRPVP